MGAVEIALALAQFAPSLMRYFGAGEASAAVAEKAIGIAQQVTGKPTGPEAVEALRQNAQLAHEFNLAVLAQDGALEQAYLADRQSARSRDIEVRKLNGGENSRADVMVISAAVGLVCCLAVLIVFRKEIPGEAVGIISTIAGIFGACLRDAFQFEFGSSKGSRDKSEIIARLTPGGKTL